MVRSLVVEPGKWRTRIESVDKSFLEIRITVPLDGASLAEKRREIKRLLSREHSPRMAEGLAMIASGLEVLIEEDMRRRGGELARRQMP